MTGTPSGSGSSFGLLAVCMGNVCRSPAVEAALIAALGPDSEVRVSSAGLRARVGASIAPDMVALLPCPRPDFSARQVTPMMIQEADLIVGMTREHRAALVTLVPESVRKTFTLREFADLARIAHEHGAVPPGGSVGRRLAAVLAAAPRFRGLRSPGSNDDIEDPYGRAPADHVRAMAEIGECLRQLDGVIVA